MGNINHVDQQLSFSNLFQCSSEGSNKLCGKLLDESDCVCKQDLHEEDKSQQNNKFMTAVWSSILIFQQA